MGEIVILYNDQNKTMVITFESIVTKTMGPSMVLLVWNPPSKLKKFDHYDLMHDELGWSAYQHRRKKPKTAMVYQTVL